MKKLMISALILTTMVFSSLHITHAFARNGADDAANSSQPTTGSTTEAEKKAQEAEAKKEADAKIAEAKKEADAKIAEAKTQAEAKKTEELQKTCEQRKESVNKKLSVLGENAQKHQEAYTKLLEKAIELRTSKNLSPANFDNLVATANSAKATSTASIEALKASALSVDCTSTDITTVKAAAKAAATAARTAANQAKNDLKAYRTTVKAVLSALEIVTT